MNIFLLTFAVSVFIVGTIFSNRSLFRSRQSGSSVKNVISEEVLSENSEDSDNGDNEIEEDDGSDDVSPVPTVKPFPTLVTISPPKEPTSPPVISGLIDSLIYPGSSVIERSPTRLLMESGSDPKAIFEWYKGKVKALNLSVTTSVFTQANDKYQIKVVGSDGKTEIEIEVNKDGNVPAKISVLQK